MKITHLSQSDTSGGAARAAYRIHHALLDHGIDSTMMVDVANSGDWTVKPPDGDWQQGMVFIRKIMGILFARLLKTRNHNMHSPANMPTWRSRNLNKQTNSITHLHWINKEMMSIADIGRLRGPIVWTLHDMWAFCGAEHYTDDFRWRDGYLKVNRPNYESGFDLNKFTWQRKQKHWKRPIHIVTPSCWLANCVKQSALMRDWPVFIVPNAIDTDQWQPINQRVARRLMRLPEDGPLILFGAMSGNNNPIKGFDLLAAALKGLQGKLFDLRLAIFGQLSPESPLDLGFPIHFRGHLYDDISLNLLYSAADLTVVPSRIEAFGQTASEAHACGTPVVAFETSGLSDIVEHLRTGYLAEPFDVEDLAQGICWVLDQKESGELSANARTRAVAQFSYPVVAEQYQRVYSEVAGQ